MPDDPAGQTRQTTLGHEPAAAVVPPVRDAVVPGAEAIEPGAISHNEMIIVAPPGHPAKSFEVHPEVTKHACQLTKPISHWSLITDVHDANQLALAPGAAKKTVVTFGH